MGILANVFGHTLYMNESTNPEFDVVAHTAVQIKNILTTIELGGSIVMSGVDVKIVSLLNRSESVRRTSGSDI